MLLLGTSYLEEVNEELLAYKTNSSNAFVVAYLLGTREDILDSNFFHDYKNAEMLEFFSDDDTYYVHLLSRVRMHILRNFMGMGREAHLTLDKFVYGRDVSELKTLGLDVYEKAKEYNDITDFLKYLCDEINGSIMGVLSKWEVMHPETVAKLFSFIEDLNWGDLVEEAVYYSKRINDFCYHRYVWHHRLMGAGRNTLLFDDDNLYRTLMKATGEKLRYKNLESTLWERVYKSAKQRVELEDSNVTTGKEEVVQVEEPELVVESEVVHEATEAEVTEENAVKTDCLEVEGKEETGDNMSSWKEAIKPLPLSFKVEERKTDTVSSDKKKQLFNSEEGLLHMTSTDSAVFYVDCDNVDVLTMLEFFMQLAKEGDAKNYKVKLFTDDMTTYGWKYLNSSVLKGIDTELIQTERIRSEKSAVDVVLTGHFIRDSLEDKRVKKVIVSSDSDYFGLATMGYDFGVLYQNEFVSTKYLQKLYKYGVKHKDVTVFKPNILSTTYKTDLVKVIVSQVLENTPITHWSDIEMVENSISNELYKMDAKDVFSDFNVKSTAIENWIKGARVDYNNGKFSVTLQEG